MASIRTFDIYYYRASILALETLREQPSEQKSGEHAIEKAIAEQGRQRQGKETKEALTYLNSFVNAINI